MPKTCVVVPCYNESRRLDIERFILYLKNNTWCHICFVNDGSSDDTIDSLKTVHTACLNNTSIIDFEKNAGKAEAIRIGMLKCLRAQSNYEYIGFFDADLATPLKEINNMLAVGKSYGGIMMLSGCRLKRLGASIDRRMVRHYLGRVFATAVSVMLNLPVYDTQCGAKLFRSAIAGNIIEKPFISKWFFDVEIFARMLVQYGREEVLRSIVEVPLQEWKDVGNSNIGVTQYLQAPIDLLRIYFHYMHKK